MITAEEARQNIKDKSTLEHLLNLYNIESSIMEASNNRHHSIYRVLFAEYAKQDYEILSDYLKTFGYKCSYDSFSNHSYLLIEW